MILFKNQESCIINGGTTARHIDFEKDTSQGDRISALFFELALEVFFILNIQNYNEKTLKSEKSFENIYSNTFFEKFQLPKRKSEI